MQNGVNVQALLNTVPLSKTMSKTIVTRNVYSSLSITFLYFARLSLPPASQDKNEIERPSTQTYDRTSAKFLSLS